MTYKRTLAGGASRLAVMLMLTGLALGGCKPGAASNGAASNEASASNAADAPAPQAALALAAGPAAPLTPAPAASALPAAPPAPVASPADPSDEYAPAEDASAANAGFGDAPPDYAFSYNGSERPWVWLGDDQSMRVAEPLPGGGFRYYYYQPGASSPYLVRDASYSYGYANGALVAVYDSHGDPIPAGSLGAQAALAGGYLARAEQINEASRQQQHEAVAEANWQAQRATVESEREQWKADAASNQAWAAYHAAHRQQEDAQWEAERYRRAAEGARFAQSINDTQQAQKDLAAAEQARAHAMGPAVAAGRTPAAPGSIGESSADQRAAAVAAKQSQRDQIEAQETAARQAKLTQRAQLVAQETAARQAKLAQRAQLVAQRTAAKQTAEQAKAEKLADEKARKTDRRPPDQP